MPTVAGSRVRVIDGMVWATTSSNPDDVWLGTGQEHTIRRPGLTVIESLIRSSVELIPPPAVIGLRNRMVNRYEMAIPKAALKVAAIAMTAITIGLLVVLPAKLEAGGPSRVHVASSIATTPPSESALSRPRDRGQALPQNIAQAADGMTAPTRVQ